MFNRCNPTYIRVGEWSSTSAASRSPTGRDLTARAIKKNYFPAAICPFQLLKLIAPLIFCNKLFFLLFLYSTYENPRFSQVLLNPGLDGRVLALIQIKQMIQQQPPFLLSKPLDYAYPKMLRTGNTPTLNKVEAFDQFLYCGYSNGLLLQYKYGQAEKSFQFVSKYYPYQNTDIIDIDQYDQDVLLTCTHNEVTLYNLTKNKSISLKGHQSTPFAVSAHPVSPYVISISNAIIEHDVRMRKPINVNFITPPAYDVEFFQDGKDYILSGDPCRVGKSKWIRSLLNGIAKPSITCKHVLTNDMNGSISLWDWRESEQLMTINNVKNTQTYQPIYFGMREGTVNDILFLQDNGSLLRYDFTKSSQPRRRSDIKLLQVGKNDNWKMTTRDVDCTTKSLILYEHTKAVMRIYDLN